MSSPHPLSHLDALDWLDQDVLVACATANEPPRQRQLAQQLKCALGRIHQAVHTLQTLGLLDDQLKLSPLGLSWCQTHRPQRALIFSFERSVQLVGQSGACPKALLPIDGDSLIERLIRQLREAGVADIYILAVHEQEAFEHLTERPGVQLISIPPQAAQSRLATLAHVLPLLADAYVLPADLYCATNPFQPYALHSWYGLQEAIDPQALFSIKRNRTLSVKPTKSRHAPLGLAYFTHQDAQRLAENLKRLAHQPKSHGAAWELALFEPSPLDLTGRLLSDREALAVETTTDYLHLLAELDPLQQEALTWAADQLGACPDELIWEKPLKKGMTNRSLSFCYRNKRYLLRIPGAGSAQLVNRLEEAEVYQAIQDWAYAEPLVAYDPATGRKLTEFVEDTRPCDPRDPQDRDLLLGLMIDLHEQAFTVNHRFDWAQKLDHYRQLCKDTPSPFRRNEAVYEQVMQLKGWLETLPDESVLCHMDLNPDNLLIRQAGSPVVIDWEYAGLQDPIFELAMLALYAGFSRGEVDALLDRYWQLKQLKAHSVLRPDQDSPVGAQEGQESQSKSLQNPLSNWRLTVPTWVRLKLYAYLACGGMLWSTWCQYKHAQGVDFGPYWKQQYQYAKTYAAYVLSALPNLLKTRSDSAILLAAGCSSRFVPQGLERPKALSVYRGEVLLARQIEQLRAAGVERIVLVTGYLAEAYEPYIKKYHLEVVYNPHYATHNNLATLWAGIQSGAWGNTYVCSVDNYFATSPFEPYVESPYYACSWSSGPTDEWCVQTDLQGRIQQISIGGNHTPYLFGHARFDRETANRLKPWLEQAQADPECADWYWESVWCQHLSEVPLQARLYPNGWIQEFDRVDEMRQQDPTFDAHNPCPLFEKACADAHLDPASCTQFRPLKRGDHALADGFQFECEGRVWAAWLNEDRDHLMLQPSLALSASAFTPEDIAIRVDIEAVEGAD